MGWNLMWNLICVHKIYDISPSMYSKSSQQMISYVCINIEILDFSQLPKETTKSYLWIEKYLNQIDSQYFQRCLHQCWLHDYDWQYQVHICEISLPIRI